MCVVSMVGDHYSDKWRQKDWWHPTFPQIPILPQAPQIDKAEFDQLKRDVMELKELLKRAKKYDAANGEPDCEQEQKLEILRKVAELVGVDLNDVLPRTAA